MRITDRVLNAVITDLETIERLARDIRGVAPGYAIPLKPLKAALKRAKQQRKRREKKR